jgi:exosome complex exonuclease RRP6
MAHTHNTSALHLPGQANDSVEFSGNAVHGFAQLVEQVASTVDLDLTRLLDGEVEGQLEAIKYNLRDKLARLLYQARDGPVDIDFEIAPGETISDLIDGNWDQIIDIVRDLMTSGAINFQDYHNSVTSSNVVKNTAPTNWQDDPDMPKPQARFELKPNNYPTGPWRPLLTQKPYAQTANGLDKSVRLVEEVEDGQTVRRYTHPYAAEIRDYTYSFTPELFEMAEPDAPSDMRFPLIFVDERMKLDAMIKDLLKAPAIAVDVEHHDTHSYQGITSLLQISTRTKDYVVDTLVPWRHELEKLNQVFANPSILKVLHGAQWDVIWLQRDLGIYIVGLFDTFEACVNLEYPRKSLGYLLERFCKVTAAKQYQRADWRIRPLPDFLLDYARSDTHHLLYIFDRMRNELCAKASASAKSIGGPTRLVGNGFVREPFFTIQEASNGLLAMLSRSSFTFSKTTFEVCRHVHAWRDKVARELDEKPFWFLSPSALCHIAINMPTTEEGLARASGRPLSRIVLERKDELLRVIQEGRVAGEAVQRQWEEEQKKIEGGAREVDSTKTTTINLEHEPAQTSAVDKQMQDYLTAPVPQPTALGSDDHDHRMRTSTFFGTEAASDDVDMDDTSKNGEVPDAPAPTIPYNNTSSSPARGLTHIENQLRLIKEDKIQVAAARAKQQQEERDRTLLVEKLPVAWGGTELREAVEESGFEV